MKLRQGFGRLIRRATDRGIVVITDVRVLTKPYGACFLRSLPKTQESFKSGAASNSDLLDASTALRTAEMNRVAALGRLRLAEAGFDLAAGVVSEREGTR